MILNVLTLTGDQHVVDVRPNDTVLSVKKALEGRTQTPSIQQRLMYQGRKLSDTDSISKYQINNGAIIQLVEAMRGGVQRESISIDRTVFP